MNINSIRPFIGSSNFSKSQAFYKYIGFSELKLTDVLSYFHRSNFGFYLQDAYVKDWIDNTMLFLEVKDLDQESSRLKELDLGKHFPSARLSEINVLPWGRVLYLHDLDGILWQIGQFNHPTKIG